MGKQTVLIDVYSFIGKECLTSVPSIFKIVTDTTIAALKEFPRAEVIYVYDKSMYSPTFIQALDDPTFTGIPKLKGVNSRESSCSLINSYVASNRDEKIYIYTSNTFFSSFISERTSLVVPNGRDWVLRDYFYFVDRYKCYPFQYVIMPIIKAACLKFYDLDLWLKNKDTYESLIFGFDCPIAALEYLKNEVLTGSELHRRAFTNYVRGRYPFYWSFKIPDIKICNSRQGN